jgi:hypothetical protein
MDCTYEILIDGEKINVGSLLDLSKYYYAKGGTLSSQRIFSSAVETNSVLLKIAKRTNEIKNDKSRVVVTNLITQKSDLFAKFGMNGDRLSPEYIEESRKLNYVLEFMPASFKSRVKSLAELEELVSKTPELKEVFDKNLKDLEETMEVEKLAAPLGSSMHRGLASLIRGEDLDEVTNIIINTHKDLLDNIED